MREVPTGSQTVGPFFHHGLIRDDLRRVPAPGTQEADVVVSGRVVDGQGEGVPDAMLEFWHPSSGFARAATDGEGRYRISLPRPRPEGPDRAPYFAVALFARGLLRQLHTRCYLPGDPALDRDPVLASVPPGRRGTLVGVPRGGEVGFDVVLQGPGETVFFTF
ncbi:MAG TPA: protocatechuate 3,4-dioxygenase subunit alpha [Thermodesulfobacteriota bacterium]|nr:protocatechuate 3,4-dioxygenase subunit alpha [Thermodesulfobacteriota bacterium]